MEEREDLIPLQQAHVNQYTNADGTKSPWEVQTNKTNELLAVLPRDLKDDQVFAVLKFARKFELFALNIGIKFMKHELMEKWMVEKNNLISIIKQLEEANGKLAEKLEHFIGNEEE